MTKLPIRVGVSSCLLGEQVRYDGSHKREDLLVEHFGAHFDWVSVCPEVESGMGTPRPPVRLVLDAGATHMRGPDPARDHTLAMEHFAKTRVHQLGSLGLSGYILKSRSPSCGMEEVEQWRPDGSVAHDGTGLFARQLMRALPELPIEEEGRLHDTPLRDAFLERVFARHRLYQLFGAGWRRGEVVAFHANHKLQVLAHSPMAYRELGRRVARIRDIPPPDFRDHYVAELMAALRVQPTRNRHVNALQHMAGHLRQRISDAERRELADAIDAYQEGSVPRSVPLERLRHHVREHEIATLSRQTYLNPDPVERSLRSDV